MIGLGLSINTANRTLATQVSAIFRGNGYNGFMYDVNDISTLNQVSTGTTPVTAVNNPIGLMLDKHLGMQLGPELKTGAAMVTGGWTESGGVITASGSSGADNVSWNLTTPTVAGKFYLVTIPNTFPLNGFYADLGGGTGSQVGALSSGMSQVIITCTSPGSIIRFGRWSGGPVGTIGPISVKLLDGNHALQATAAARPTWQVDASGHHYAQFLGTDDSLSCATGGGGNTGFLFCCALKPTGGAGTLRTIYSDTGTNTGYKVQLDVNNKLSFSAGDNAAFTTKVSTATVDVGTTYLLTCWDDGTNLNVQINAAAAETVARPVVVAGTAGYTLGKDNGAASSFLIADIYRMDGFKNTGLTVAQRSSVQAWVKAGAGL